MKIERTALPDLQRFAGCSRYAGGDLGLTTDSSSLAIVGAVETELALLEIVELRPEKGQPLKLSKVIGEFAGILKEHKLGAFMADGWSREAAREHAENAGIEIESAPEGNAGKVQVYTSTRDALREGQLRLINIPRLRAQLRAVVARPIAGGGLRISSPRRSGHGDLVSALVLAVWQARDAAESTVEYDPTYDEFIPRLRV